MLIAKGDAVVREPAELPCEVAAKIPVVGVTALQVMLGKGKLRASQTVVSNGCLSGVGENVITLLRTVVSTYSCRPAAVTRIRCRPERSSIPAWATRMEDQPP